MLFHIRDASELSQGQGQLDEIWVDRLESLNMKKDGFETLSPMICIRPILKGNFTLKVYSRG